MKRLITEEDVLRAIHENRPILIDKNTIITPQAQDVAKAYHIQFKEESEYCDKIEHEEKCCKEKECKSEDEKTSCHQDCQDSKKFDTAILSEDEIYKLLSVAMENGLLSEAKLDNMIKSFL